MDEPEQNSSLFQNGTFCESVTVSQDETTEAKLDVTSLKCIVYRDVVSNLHNTQVPLREPTTSTQSETVSEEDGNEFCIETDDTKPDLSLIKIESCLEETEKILENHVPTLTNEDIKTEPDQNGTFVVDDSDVTVETDKDGTNVPIPIHRHDDDHQSAANSSTKNRTSVLVPIQRNDDASHSDESNAAVCEYCGRIFKLKANLCRHYRTHTGEKPFTCTICKRKFRRKTSLETHYNMHNNKKKHQCKLCDKSFHETNDLEKHHRVHTGEKPHQCQLCQKCFSQKGNLERHLRIHTGEKPFKCEVCPAAFSEHTEFRRHLRKHTGEKPYKCLICMKLFTKKMYLTKHREVHNDGATVKRCRNSKRKKKTRNRVKQEIWHTPCT